MPLSVIVRVPDSGLPEWQEAILSGVGVFIAFGVLWLLYKLIALAASFRERRRRGPGLP